jgi:hypothetical protein
MTNLPHCVAFTIFEHFVPFGFRSRQNKSPFAIALGDWFPIRTYVLTSKASPNDSGIVIVVIIIVVGEAQSVFHMGGIIAQTVTLDRVSLPPNKKRRRNDQEPMGDRDVRRV